jgi:phosphoserine aminotransferase
VIVRKDLIKDAHPYTPSILNYELFEKSHSLYNTSPVFSWYVLGLMMQWAIKQGGVEVLAKQCEQKSQMLYEVIDNSKMYTNKIAPAFRSRVNVPFSLPNEQLDALFLEQAHEAGLKQLKGHKTVGGCRASLYNAMPLEGAKALVDFMRAFEQKNS